MVSAIEGLPLIPILAHSYDGPEETAQKLCQLLLGLAQLLAHSQKLRIVHGGFQEKLLYYEKAVHIKKIPQHGTYANGVHHFLLGIRC